MALNKTCKQCSKDFVVEDDDLAFYKKISPTFSGKTFEIPAPTLCPLCREIKRLSWRNERSLYKRKSDKSGKEIVSMFSPDKTEVRIYSPDEWWADDWDTKDMNLDFDPSRSFFEQMKELYYKVPQPALKNMLNENCEFSNFIMECKNCYMSFVCYYGSENTHFSWGALSDKDCVDTYLCDHCEKCYKLIYSNGCYNCNWSNRLLNSRDCCFSIDLIGCSDCFLCSNLNRKQYYIRNAPYSKEEYFEEIGKYNLGYYSQNDLLKNEYKKMTDTSFVKFAKITNCENCTGDDLLNSKDCHYCYSQTECENVKYSYRGRELVDCQDLMGGSVELVYDCSIVGYGKNNLFCSDIEYCSNMIYCITCFHSKDCFACVGLRNKQYCIFNKQYTKEEYEKKVNEIIEILQKNSEWGEFFPFNFSPFGFNETLGFDYIPMKKEKALTYGLKWQDNDFALKHDGPFYEPKDNIETYMNDPEERQKLLNGILKCEVSGKPYKIMPQELAFYLDHKVPIPRVHYNQRHIENISQTNPRHLWNRQCMCEETGHGHDGRCKVEFETTYAPERPEKVYCEDCYQKSIL